MSKTKFTDAALIQFGQLVADGIEAIDNASKIAGVDVVDSGVEFTYLDRTYVVTVTNHWPLLPSEIVTEADVSH